MAITTEVFEAAGRRIEVLWPQLSERQRRALLGAEARELGWGGVAAVAKVAGVARSTVNERHPDRTNSQLVHDFLSYH